MVIIQFDIKEFMKYQHMNMIMEECHERVYSSDAGVEQVVLGLYIVRGDNMYVSLHV